MTPNIKPCKNNVRYLDSNTLLQRSSELVEGLALADEFFNSH